jgi:hypothetical protein
MADYMINISINLNGLRGELQRSLQRTVYLVSAGLQTKDRIDPDHLRLPTNSITMIFDGGLKWDAQTAEGQYSEWILSNGFRDLIEYFNTFFESAHRVLASWELATRQKDGIKITGSDWNRIIISGGKSFHRLGLPDKFSHVEGNHHIPIDAKLREQILSINAARNCLVHRNGVVTEQDLNATSALEVKWTSLVVIVKSEDGEKDLVLGEVVEKDSVIAIRNKESVKTFSLGKRVLFTAREFANIAWGLFLFGNDLVQKISDFGVRNGFLKAPGNGNA